jgi:hypothetical protein
VITTFVEEVINQGRFKRANDLVALDFVELDPLPGQQQGREGLKQRAPKSRGSSRLGLWLLRLWLRPEFWIPTAE